MRQPRRNSNLLKLQIDKKSSVNLYKEKEKGGSILKKKIDFVIAWVDGTDISWRKQREAYKKECSGGSLQQWNDSESRYRDWGLLPYWFRAVEKFAPWVNNIYFVTCGQVPQWLNEEHPKLKLIEHKDYIPKKYLPTFNSHCIELNFHRIPGLSEQFVYFNDDMFLLQPTQPEDFFVNGLPCGTPILTPVRMVQNGIRAEINDLYVINHFFKKNEVILNNWKKWLNPKYKKVLLRTLLLMIFPGEEFPGFFVHHVPQGYLKETFEEVWNLVPQILDETCRHRFRDTNDVNQWLFEYWQYAKGRFAPRSPYIGEMFEGEDTYQDMCNAIRGQRYKLICCNDSIDFYDFEARKNELQKAFQEILPDKSLFEK